MKEFTYKITDELGIHARPAGLLVKKASEFKSDITVYRDEKSADLKRLFSVMGLAAKKGDILRVTADGEDEAKAAEELEFYFKNNL